MQKKKSPPFQLFVSPLVWLVIFGLRWKSEFSHLSAAAAKLSFWVKKRTIFHQCFLLESGEKKQAASPVGTRARRLPTTEPLRSNYSSAIRQTYLFCATSRLLLLIDEGGRWGGREWGEENTCKQTQSTRTHTGERVSERARARLWSAKMSASLGEAHMHFREVPLIRREIQLKTWSGSPPRFDTAPDSSRRWVATVAVAEAENAGRCESAGCHKHTRSAQVNKEENTLLPHRNIFSHYLFFFSV